MRSASNWRGRAEALAREGSSHAWRFPRPVGPAYGRECEPGGGGEHGAAFDDRVPSGGIGPTVPETGEGERLAIATSEEPRHAGVTLFFPFVEAAAGQDAPLALAPGRAEGGFRGDGLGAGVDELGTGSAAFANPVGNETPVEDGGLAEGVRGRATQGGDAGGGSDIVSITGLGRLTERNPEAFAEVDGIAELECEAGAHAGDETQKG